MVNFILFILGVIGIVLFGTFVFLVQIVRKPFKNESLKKYFLALAIGLDQLGGSIIYGLEDWCISSVAYYDAEHGKNVWFMNLINFLFNDKEHCKKSYENEFKKLGVKPIR